MSSCATTLGQILIKAPKDKTACLFLGKANEFMIRGVDKKWTVVDRNDEFCCVKKKI